MGNANICGEGRANCLSDMEIKQAKISEYIEKLRNQLEDENITDEDQLTLLAQQMVYERIKQQLSVRNGRIILK